MATILNKIFGTMFIFLCIIGCFAIYNSNANVKYDHNKEIFRVSKHIWFVYGTDFTFPKNYELFLTKFNSDSFKVKHIVPSKQNHVFYIFLEGK